MNFPPCAPFRSRSMSRLASTASSPSQSRPRRNAGRGRLLRCRKEKSWPSKRRNRGKACPTSRSTKANSAAVSSLNFPIPPSIPLRGDLDRIAGTAWDAYRHHHKAPRTRKAGEGFVDPDYDLARDWLAAHEAVCRAQSEYEDPAQPPCVLIIKIGRESCRERVRLFV